MLFAVVTAAPLVRETGLLLSSAVALEATMQRRWRRALLYAASALPALGWFAYVQAHTSAAGGGPRLLALPLLGIYQRLFLPSGYHWKTTVSALAQTLDWVATAGALLIIALAFRCLALRRDGLAFADHAAKNLDATLVKHEKFLTASLFLKDGTRIDIATARTEYYEAPTELPQVEISTIKKDLYRRDFTINAMAIKLNQKDFGLLLDFFGAKKDLENKIIRCLHTLSFVEDPTRILRAVRFEPRFDFHIE
jgi:hypothetical protein